MYCPVVRTVAIPRATDIIPSVTRNGKIPTTATSSPLTNPQSSATVSPASNAGVTGVPLRISKAIVTDERASTEPTDKSIPRTIRTIVIAMAIRRS